MYFLRLACIFFICLQQVTTSDLRNSYKTAISNEQTAEVFFELTEHINNSPLHHAYRGAAFAIMARYNGKKIKRLRKAKKWIEEAVSQAPNNIEIRMIRLSIQENLPKIVGYHQAISQDKAYIIAHYSKIKKKVLKFYIAEFIRESKSFLKKEKQQLLSNG